MDTQTFRTITEKKNIYLSDKFLSHFMRKLHKPSVRGYLYSPSLLSGEIVKN